MVTKNIILHVFPYSFFELRDAAKIQHICAMQYFLSYSGSQLCLKLSTQVDIEIAAITIDHFATLRKPTFSQRKLVDVGSK